MSKRNAPITLHFQREKNMSLQKCCKLLESAVNKGKILGSCLLFLTNFTHALKYECKMGIDIHIRDIKFNIKKGFQVARVMAKWLTNLPKTSSDKPLFSDSNRTK